MAQKTATDGVALGAISDFDTSLAVRPLVADVYYHSALASQVLGNLEEAESDLAKAFQLDPMVDRRK